MGVPARSLCIACAAALALSLAMWASITRAGESPVATDVPDSCKDTLISDADGARGALKNAGLTLCVGYLGEILGNVSGGIRRGTVYEDHLELTLGIDLDKVVSNTVVRARAFQIDGRGLSANYLGNNLLTVSGFEAERTTRLFDLWIETQPIKDVVSIKLGQFSADDEFIISYNGALFVNSSFGWPGKEAADLPSGGPAFPLSTPGVRVKGQVNEQWSVMAAVFNGDPAGPGSATAQSRDASGTAFRLDDGAFAIAEVAYQTDGSDRPDGIKVGGWYHTRRFADQRLDTLGRSLASPASSHIAAQHRGDYGIYGIMDEKIWPRCQESSDSAACKADKRGLEGFLRLGASPSDRNLVDIYADGGFTYAFDEGGKNAVGLGVAYARISAAASALDRDVRFFGGVRPIRDHELAIELTYHAKPDLPRRWLLVQPDLQVILHPGGHVPDPTDPTKQRAIRDAVVIGVRTAIAF